MSEQILGIGLWLILLFGIPLALAVATVSLWADGLASAGGRPRFNNGVVVLMLLIYAAFWLLLLRFLYLPGLRFDPEVTSITPLFSPGFRALTAIQQLYGDFMGWLQVNPLSAAGQLLLVAAVLGAPLFLARVMGELSGRVLHHRWR